MLLGGDAMLKRVMTGLYALVVMSGWVVGTGSLSAAGAPKVYVGLFKDDAVAVIDTAQNKVVSTISVPKGPHGLVMTPDGRKVYVSSDGASTVSVIDTATDRVVSSIDVGTNPHGLAISADGSRDGESVGIRAHVDAGDHTIRCRVDDAHRGGAVTADVDLPAVRRHHESMRPLRDRDGADHLVLGGVDDGHRIVLEETHIDLGRSGGRERTRPDHPPAHHDQRIQPCHHALQHGVTSEKHSHGSPVPTPARAIRSPVAPPRESTSNDRTLTR